MVKQIEVVGGKRIGNGRSEVEKGGDNEEVRGSSSRLYKTNIK